MKSTFASVAHESLARGEREQGGAMGDQPVVYELRIYHVVPGKMENLIARLRDQTMKLFADYGIKNVAYWTALDEPVKSGTFFYIQVVEVFHPAVGDPKLAHCFQFFRDHGLAGIAEQTGSRRF
jgi:hypothetical protein